MHDPRRTCGRDERRRSAHRVHVVPEHRHLGVRRIRGFRRELQAMPFNPSKWHLAEAPLPDVLALEVSRASPTSGWTRRRAVVDQSGRLHQSWRPGRSRRRFTPARWTRPAPALRLDRYGGAGDEQSDHRGNPKTAPPGLSSHAPPTCPSRGGRCLNRRPRGTSPIAGETRPDRTLCPEPSAFGRGALSRLTSATPFVASLT